MVACIDLATAARDGESDRSAPASVVWANAGTVNDTEKAAKISRRTIANSFAERHCSSIV